MALGVVALVGIAVALVSYVVLDLSVSEFYYSSFTRSYQLLAGVAVMVATRLFGLREDRRWLSVVGVGGLLIVGGVLTLPVVTSGLLATGFAVLCMLSSQSVLLDNPWVERLGLWSYGIYLWHFPINEYLLNERLGTPAVTAFGVTLVAATGLAALTYRFFETPIRTAKAPAGVTFAATGLTVVVGWLALGLLAPPATPRSSRRDRTAAATGRRSRWPPTAPSTSTPSPPPAAWPPPTCAGSRAGWRSRAPRSPAATGRTSSARAST